MGLLPLPRVLRFLIHSVMALLMLGPASGQASTLGLDCALAPPAGVGVSDAGPGCPPHEPPRRAEVWRASVQAGGLSTGSAAGLFNGKGLEDGRFVKDTVPTLSAKTQAAFFETLPNTSQTEPVKVPLPGSLVLMASSIFFLLASARVSNTRIAQRLTRFRAVRPGREPLFHS